MSSIKIKAHKIFYLKGYMPYYCKTNRFTMALNLNICGRNNHTKFLENRMNGLRGHREQNKQRNILVFSYTVYCIDKMQCTFLSLFALCKFSV